MIIEKNKIIFTTSDEILRWPTDSITGDVFVVKNIAQFSYIPQADSIGYTATHGRVSATAPTMHEAIALCACGVGQVKNVK